MKNWTNGESTSVELSSKNVVWVVLTVNVMAAGTVVTFVVLFVQSVDLAAMVTLTPFSSGMLALMSTVTCSIVRFAVATGKIMAAVLVEAVAVVVVTVSVVEAKVLRTEVASVKMAAAVVGRTIFSMASKSVLESGPLLLNTVRP